MLLNKCKSKKKKEDQQI